MPQIKQEISTYSSTSSIVTTMISELRKGNLSNEQLALITYILGHAKNNEEEQSFCKLFSSLCPFFELVAINSSVDIPTDTSVLLHLASTLIRQKSPYAVPVLKAIAEHKSADEILSIHPDVKKTYLNL